VLAAALRLAFCEVHELHGYELFARLTEWEGEAPMNHGTLYRCLRSLEDRGLLDSSVDRSTERLRVNYRLTPEGVEAARHATRELAAESSPLRWLDGHLADRALPAPS
jgi:DNA-binding PadR family transcriptional regulator